MLTIYTYDTEADMRHAHPYLANHLATIAQQTGDIYTAQTNGRVYIWS